MARCERPRKWMRLTLSIDSGMTCSESPFINHSKPSRMPMTCMFCSSARIVAAAMTLLMPGAGPPPTRIARLLFAMCSGLYEPKGHYTRRWPAAGIRCPGSGRRDHSELEAGRRQLEAGSWKLRPIRLAPDPLHRNLLSLEHLMQRVHAGGGFVDVTDEGDRALEDRLELLLVL